RENWCLGGARGRSFLDPLFRQSWTGLRERIAVSDPSGTSGRGTGGASGQGRGLIKVYKYAAGAVESRDSVDPAWLAPDSGVTLWVDLHEPTPEEARVLYDVFHFNELSIEDALSEIHQPKIESYGDYLYLVLHGIDFNARQHKFRTKDVDFFLTSKYLVTVHHGLSRSVGRVAEACSRNAQVLA